MDSQLKKIEQDCDRLNQELSTLQQSIPVSKAVKAYVPRRCFLSCVLVLRERVWWVFEWTPTRPH